MSKMTAEPLIIQSPENLAESHPHIMALAKQLSLQYVHQAVVPEENLKLIGQQLWAVLDVEAEFAEAKRRANLQILPLVIVGNPVLPWECLYHPQDGFLGKDSRYTLSRQYQYEPVSLPLTLPKGPLRVLLFTAQPDDLAAETMRLDTEAEQAHVLEALDRPFHQGLVTIDTPDDGRFSKLKQKLREEEFHLVFLSGHGSFDTDKYSETYQKATFLFEGEDGSGVKVTASEIARAFVGTSVQCVVLSACQSGKMASDDLNAGLMVELVAAGLPHVIGMRESILDRAGILFAQAFCEAVARKEVLPVAMQESRAAITKPLETAEPWRDADREGLAELSLGQWCLPILMSHAPMQGLIDWDFTPQVPESEVFFVDSLADNITLPPVFIGRRKELRELGQALASGRMRQLLITGPGGQGKTALAGKLVRKLEQQGYLVHAYSARPSESSWDNFVFHLKSSLSDQGLEQVERRWGLCPSELQQVQLLLNALVQHNKQLVLLFDNLESVQEPETGQLTDATLMTWLQAAQKFKSVVILLTSRWAVPGVEALPLARPSYGDFLRYIQYLNLDLSIERKRDLYPVLGGNFKGLQLFQAAQQLGIGQSAFLERVQTAQRDLQVYMAVEQVVGYLQPEERVLLERLPVYATPVTEMGIKAIAGDLVAPLDGLQRLVSLALVDVEIAKIGEKRQRAYQISPLVTEWLQWQGVEKPALEFRRLAAEHLMWLFENGLDTVSHVIAVHEALQLAEQQEEANRFALDYIVPYFRRVGMNRTLLDKWLPTLRKSGDKKTQAEAIGYSARTYHVLGDYETALDYLQQSLKISRKIGDRAVEGTIRNNISQIYSTQGDYETALDYVQQSLEISREIGNRAGEGTALNNISQIYSAQGDYETALDYMQQSLKISREIGDLAGSCTTLFNMGHNCWQTEKQQQAYAHWLNAYAIAKKIGHAQALAALESLAKQLGGEGLEFWERLVSEQDLTD
jgi:tetratricopeptide (TPR) repeat protein